VLLLLSLSLSPPRYANLFSSAFTALGLLVTLEITEVLQYLSENPGILPHIFTMAVCSAIGQLFIFYTIKKYGPLVFATIQTVRQFLSVVLSIIFFAHPLNAMEAVGILMVFAALGVQIGSKWRGRKSKPIKDAPTPPNAESVEMREVPAEADSPKAALLRARASDTDQSS
jgi:drug/metabolite transporter (DMT)-like permease